MDIKFRSITRDLFAVLDTPRALTCYILVKYGEWDQLVHLYTDPRDYCGDELRLFLPDRCSFRYHRDCQATEWLRKCDGLETTLDLEQAAVTAFYSAEMQCCAANVRLSRHFDLPVLEDRVAWHADVLIRKATRWIASVLGEIPPRLTPRFGPGSVFEKESLGARDVTSYTKLNVKPSGTLQALELAEHVTRSNPALKHAWSTDLAGQPYGVVRGNRFTTVPKDAKTLRGICIEPGFNLACQLSVGSVLKRRLARVGLDLTKGQALHQELARTGSLSGAYVTIDLSSASDTIPRKLVENILPADWAWLLGTLRSPFTRINDRWVFLEKYSSMGNGYTFELETLVFAALVSACGGVIGINSFVYGDDIICPPEVAENLVPILRYCGFSLNTRKSFLSGPFRESCGGDFFSGVNTTPLRIKALPSDPAGWIRVHNALIAIEDSIGVSLKGPRKRCIEQVPAAIRKCRGPRGLGDLVFTDEAARPRIRGCVHWYYVWRPVARVCRLYLVQRWGDTTFSCRNPRYHRGVPTAAMHYGLPSTGVSPRGVTGWKVGRAAYSLSLIHI